MPTTIQQAIALHQNGRLSEAEFLYTQILKVQHDHFDALHLLGMLMHQQGHSQAALDLIAKALAVNPQSADAYANRARVLAALRQYELALMSNERALDLTQNDADVLCDRAKLFDALGRHKDAVATYDRVLAMRPDMPEVLNDRGVILQKLKRYDDANASYARAIDLLPGEAILYCNRGNVLAMLGRFHEALANYNRALALRPDHIEALSNRGNVLYELDRFEESLNSYKAALVLRPTDADILILVGRSLTALKRFDDALTNYDRALVLRPDCPLAYYNRGLTLQDMNSHGILLPTLTPAAKVPECYAGYYINLDRSVDRRVEIEAEIARHGQDRLYRRFSAADGNVLGFPTGKRTNGEIGVLTSLYLLLKQNAGRRTHLHVVEDDVVFSPYATQAVASVITSGLIDRFDILFTETLLLANWRNYRELKALYDDSLERDAVGNVTRVHPKLINYLGGATSYIINYNSIPRLLEIFDRELVSGPSAALDIIIRKAADKGAIRVGCIFPFVTGFSIGNVEKTTITDRTTDPFSRLALALGRHSFFVGCDHESLSRHVAETLPLGKQPLYDQSMRDNDAHQRLLDHIIAFSRTENFHVY